MDDGLRRKSEIESRLKQIAAEKDALFIKIGRLQNSTIRDLRDRLRGVPEGDQRYADIRNSIVSDLQKAEQLLKESNELNEALSKERSDLMEIELPACKVDICAEDVLEHLRQVDRSKNEVQNLQAAIEAQNHVVSEALATIPKPICREHKRQNLMAEIVLGNATEGDLKTLDEEILNEQKAIQGATNKVAPIIDKAQAALSGLGRKLQAAQDELLRLESRTSEVKNRFFVGEAEKVGAQFANHALHLKELYIRLVGLDEIIKKYDVNGIMAPTARRLFIPTFRLPQFEGLESPHYSDGTLFNPDDEFVGEQIDQAVKNEKLRLHALIGIRI